LLEDGTVQCWGCEGEPNGLVSDCSVVPARVNALAGVTAVSVGFEHACALLADGTVECWGHNADGQLGDGSTTDSLVPVVVSGLTGATMVSVGGDIPTGWAGVASVYGTSCAVLTSGTVQCWGFNSTGALGNGSTTSSSVPLPVSLAR
jgi:alpha-tubulin suppressor-like RCC1 family protein